MNLDLSVALDSLRELAGGALALIPQLIIALVALALFFAVAKWLRGLVQRLTGGDEPQNVSILLGKVTQWTIAVIGLLVALMILVPSFKLTGLVAALGLSGVAIGFAFKDIFQNFLAGIPILLTNPFRVGDQIAVADSTVNLRLRWWTDPTRAEVIHIQDRVLRAVQTAFNEEGIDMPFPTQVLLFHDQTEATDGDRSEQREGWPAGGGDVPEPARIGLAIAQAGENGDGSGDGKQPSRQAAEA
jgi:small-conductance mechanosensitive channel